MSEDLGSSILLTMAPIFVLMIGMVVYGVVKNRNKVKGQSKHETDALIEAQAMLAKYQKEQAEKESKSDKPEEKKEDETKAENKTEEKPEEKAEPAKDKKPEDKTQKPTADAPISDTTELEPDIDKTDDK